MSSAKCTSMFFNFTMQCHMAFQIAFIVTFVITVFALPYDFLMDFGVFG